MPGGFTNQPKILRGAFVEYGLSIPPLFVVFQFNPVQLSRNRSISYAGENEAAKNPPSGETDKEEEVRTIQRQSSLRDFHQKEFKDRDDLLAIRDRQQVTIKEEAISFEIRLDATDQLNDEDPIAGKFGIAPQLATLELMLFPKEESRIGEVLSLLSKSGFSFTRGKNPPLILFIWGRKKVLPVNITSMNITETEFSTTLNPIRATVAVSLTVIEGPNIPYTYSKVLMEASSSLNLANIADIADVVIPG